MNPSVVYEPEVHEERATVLVVEDEVFVRLAIVEELRDQGLTVIEAASADEAVSVLQSSVPVHLLLTDIQMAGEADAFIAIFGHAISPKMKVVITSCQEPDDYLRQVAAAFFSKPYDTVTVAGRVKELLVDSERKATRH
jgi:two-component system, response regulator PdtaR